MALLRNNTFRFFLVSFASSAILLLIIKVIKFINPYVIFSILVADASCDIINHDMILNFGPNFITTLIRGSDWAGDVRSSC